jgi:hypothetical protein
MKFVKAYSNTPDNTFCLQACVLSVLTFYFPEKIFKEVEVSDKTGYHPKFFSWIPQAVVWLAELGLNVELYSPFNYKRFANEGLAYLREFKKDAYIIEEERGEYKYLPEIQVFAKKMVSKKIWVDKMLSVEELRDELKNEKTLAIGKTIYELLDRRFGITSHFIVLVKEYSSGVWLIQDSGLPMRQDRKVDQYFNNDSILGDTILIKGLK